ncbi:MAG: lipid-A-disaccharide synthase [Bacteroides sp.]|nr:lipid-A-disaccharide synthase [Bacteroides sp.]
MNYFFSAGEASGDLHAAQVIAALRKLDADAHFTFLGGDMMAREAGCEPLIHYRDMAFMGFTEVIKHLPEIFRNMRVARGAIKSERPDVVVLVDYPGFNLKLADYARSLGLKTVYYIAPKVWAWKEYRVKTLARVTDRLLSILPFEPKWFGSRGLNVDYVGNPSVEEMDRALAVKESPEEFRLRHGLDSRPLLALVPGSRKGEIAANLPVMDAVAGRHPELQAVVAGAPGISPDLYKKYTRLPMIEGTTLSLMAQSDVALVTSGTASLECALAATPQVVCYRSVGWKWAHDLFTHILKIPYVSLPNLIAGPVDAEARKRENSKRNEPRGAIIPELLVHHCNADEVDAALTAILPGTPGAEKQLRGYAEMRARLATGERAARNAARIIYDVAAQAGCGVKEDIKE